MWPMRRIPAMDVGVLGERSVEVALGPGREPEQRVGGRPAQLVVVRRDGEHAAGMVDRAGDVAARQRQRGAVHLDRARQCRQLRLVDDDHARGVAGRGRQRQPLLDVAQVVVDAIELAGRHQRAHEADGEHRPDAHDVVGDELRPRAHRRVLPAAAQAGSASSASVGGPVEVAGRERVPDRVGRLVVLGEPGARPAMQLDRGVRDLRRGAARAARRRRGGGTDTTRVDRRAGSRTGSRRSSASSAALPPVAPVTASQSDPCSRSRTDVCSMNRRTDSGWRCSTSPAR